jgi:hypothetical protein
MLKTQLFTVFMLAFLAEIADVSLGQEDGWTWGGIVGGIGVGALGTSRRRFERIWLGGLLGWLAGRFEAEVFYSFAYSRFFSP